MLRRFWWPALLSSEITEPDGEPVRLRLLGEDLLVFKDTEGRIGLVDAYCPHRRAPMFFGRNEECGLRCVFHGWKFDKNGNCVDMPSEPAESNYKDKVHITAYSAAEWGGVVWIYMGPKHLQPELPQYEWCTDPPADQIVWKWQQESNYLQGLEGKIGRAHV